MSTPESARKTKATAAAATPMMAQYIEIKAANPDCMLFYRMGDFYELFFEDAVEASKALGITLTKRGKHAGEDIPMAGVPVHTADDYLQRLIACGYRVAVCEQIEDPQEAKKRGSNAVVRRAVQRLVTPGTVTEEKLLDAGRNSFLAAVTRDRAAPGDATLALAWCDLTTGEFAVMALGAGALSAEFARIAPKEVLVPESGSDFDAVTKAVEETGAALTILPNTSFESTGARDRLMAYFGVATLDGFADYSRAEQAAAAAIIGYIDKTQVGKKAALSPPRHHAVSGLMAIDAATRTNLELVRNQRGEMTGTLLAAIDRTVTAAGRRRLARDITGPLTDPAAIAARHDAVEVLYDGRPLRSALRDGMKRAPDIARAKGRVSLGRAGPRDLGQIRDGLAVAAGLAETLTANGQVLPGPLAAVASTLAGAAMPLAESLTDALAEDLPVLRRDGGFVRPGHSPDLDDVRALRDESRQVIAGMQADYAEATAVKALKVRHNNVLGYFVEVTALHADRLMAPPLNETFIHRQTLANAVRFTTKALADLESKIITAAERALALENAIFDRLTEEVCAESSRLQAIAEALAALDVFAAHAECADLEGYVRPKVDATLAFSVSGGRHPVVEQALKRAGDAPFVVNDCGLGPKPEDDDNACRLWLLTGPNMAGKSTFLRQNALIAILAQAGAFVPATSAHIGVVTRLFSRVGASDDLARGRSTFMVEMVETAAILNQADTKSLVILDEIGRGTATFDGLSIAWATVEHLHEVNRCRALFATHFHELTALTATLPRAENATVKVKEWNGEVVFLHEVTEGAADRSYGIQVARLAGLPSAVTERARAILDRLEAGDRGGKTQDLTGDLPLFSAEPARAPRSDPVAAALLKALSEIEPDHTTPLAALDAIYALKRIVRDAGGSAAT